MLQYLLMPFENSSLEALQKC